MLEVLGVSLGFPMPEGRGLVRVLKDLSFSARNGSFTMIVGPSGCGKSTLLKCLAGLLSPDKGRVWVNGDNPYALKKMHGVGFVFQKPVFFDWMTMYDNIVVPLRLASVPGAVDFIAEASESFGLASALGQYPHELSGGMLTRAALIRALVHKPDLLLLDEAFDHLDEVMRVHINNFVEQYWLETTPTVVGVTHNLAEAVRMSDQIIALSNKPARVVGSLKVDLCRPRNQFGAESERIEKLVEHTRRLLRIGHTHWNE